MVCEPNLNRQRRLLSRLGHDVWYFEDNRVNQVIAEKILKPLAATPWGTKDFYLEDPDGYILSFGGATNRQEK